MFINCTFQRFVIAGFANGVVALWNLGTRSPILLNDKVLHPAWSFYAHASVITGKTGLEI